MRHALDIHHPRVRKRGYLYISSLSRRSTAASSEGAGVNFPALLPSTWAGATAIREISWTLSAGGWKPSVDGGNVNGHGQDTNTSVTLLFSERVRGGRLSVAPESH